MMVQTRSMTKNTVNTLTPRRKLVFDDHTHTPIVDQSLSPKTPHSEIEIESFKACTEVHTLSDLIKVIKQWKSNRSRYITERLSFTEIEYDNLVSILPHLKKLNRMIGMTDLKNSIVKQMLYFVQNLHGNEMMNIVLVGHPGTGKTSVAELLGKIYSTLRIIPGEFKKVGRSELVGKYLGHTADKTKKLLESCKGGVLFIDEAYSLGIESDDKDSFARECINTLTQFLSENTDTICILAGYEHELRTRLFSQNPGLDRRFPWWFRMDAYTSNDLKEIFLYLVKKSKWKLKCKNQMMDYFTTTKNFPNYGGDCQFFLNKCKIEHANRIFGYNEDKKAKARYRLNSVDVQNGYRSYMISKKTQDVVDTDYKTLMYI